ncbi:uncharacterized protein A4U43_C01F14940 [Asparagus officinalis]|uniref:Anaphase-promoting complex subunit 4 WD40 domain-containing protein n=1 Tax=Asparagus officinalis TaxID=4686 RepID=A0A5P1FQ93_ASPOF|nr:mitotic checkpoint protein BUB3.3 [Asparagus officinalis]ONK80194.1 uncharacterized protein A4U43_C01F14940 [Asparagus officinalis]
MEKSRLDLKKPIEDSISKIRFAPNSNNLLISSWDSILRLYDVDGSVMRFEAQSEGALLDCCFQDEFTALSAGSDGCVRRYDLCSNTQAIVGKHADSVIYVEYSEQTGQVITAGLDKKLLFWDFHMKKGDARSIKATDSEVWSISISGLHLLAAIGTEVVIYDLRNIEKPVQSKDFSKKYQIWRVHPFTSCQGYAVGSIDGCVELKYYDPSEDSAMGYAFWCHPKSKDRSSHLVAVNDIKFHPFNKTFVTGDNEGHTIIWNAESRKRLFEIGRHPNSVASLAFNQGGQVLAVASSHTYQEANEIEDVSQIFIHKWEDFALACSSESYRD